MRLSNHRSRYLVESLEDRLLLSFVTAPSYSVGPSPAVAAGDFNGDGHMDFATANSDLSILLGNGDGTFRPRTDYPAGSGARSIVAADFNNDGALDVAVTNWEDITLLLGNGDGSFQAPSSFAAGQYPFFVTAADLNADGNRDLVVTNLGPNGAVHVLLGDGNGTFQSATSYPVGFGPYSVAAQDLNRDGAIDLAVANLLDNSVSVLLGNGDGSFGPKSDYAVGSYAYSVAIAELNGDGAPDLVLACSDGDPSHGEPSHVSVLLGNGNGTFRPQVKYAVGFEPLCVVVGDWDGDGDRDIATADRASNTVSLLLGNRNGTFQSGPRFAVRVQPVFLAAGDIDEDGDPDLAVLTNDSPGGGSPELVMLLGKGDGTFAGSRSYTAGTHPQGVATGDFDSDGILDLAVANYHSNNVSVFRGAGNGSFQTAASYVASTEAISLVVGDFNRDGHPDLAVSGSPGVGILLGRGDGTFGPPAWYQTRAVTPSAIALGDFNGDGKLDLVVVSYFWDAAAVLLGVGNGTLSPAVYYNTDSGCLGVAVADFNGDGKSDIATANDASNTVGVLLGNGNGTFEPRTDYPARLGLARSIVAADFNNDGHVDVVVANEFSSDVSVLLGNGNGAFQAAVIYPAAAAWSIAVGDFNRDGAPDVAVGFDTVTVMLGRGDGTLLPPTSYAVGMDARSVTAGDFDRDGFPDIAVSNWSANTVTVLLNDGVWATKTWIGPSSGGDWSTAANWNPVGVPGARDVVVIAASELNISGSATVGSLYLTGGAALTVEAGGGRVLRTSSLSITGNAKLDLTDNSAVIDYTGPVGTLVGDIRQHLASGRLTSSSADPARRLGYGDNALLGMSAFAGQSVGSCSILIKYTYGGDANLDGQVDVYDLGKLATNWQTTNVWTGGDFNYDGVVDVSDLGILATNWQRSLPAARSSSAIDGPVSALRKTEGMRRLVDDVIDSLL